MSVPEFEEQCPFEWPLRKLSEWSRAYGRTKTSKERHKWVVFAIAIRVWQDYELGPPSDLTDKADLDFFLENKMCTLRARMEVEGLCSKHGYEIYELNGFGRAFCLAAIHYVRTGAQATLMDGEG